MVLHTFGRDLKWNPHIHCLISEGGYSDDGFWRNINHFNYNFLRNAFRTALLNEMELKLGPSFKKVKAACYSKHEHGFCVYAKPNKCDPSTVIKYIGRYLGWPVIATSRIDSYDGDSVTFHYNRHEDNKYVVVRKGYEHPEIVMKIISVLFDYTRYGAQDADEVNAYFALNVDPTARPLVINIDYNEATFQITKDIQSVMSGMRKETDLSAIEKSYYDAAEKFIQGRSETAEDWAAYESRLAAVGRLIEGNYRTTAKRYLDDSDGEIPKSLQQLEKDSFIQIIMGVQPVDYFDEFVKEWYE